MDISRRRALIGLASAAAAASLPGCGAGGSSGGVVPTPANTTYDLIVVGAGVAGISAGRTAASYGAKTLILEAQNYVGGRVKTDTATFPEIGFDLGAQFYQAVSQGNELYQIAQQEGLELVAAAGNGPPNSLFTSMTIGSAAADPINTGLFGATALAIKGAIETAGDLILAGAPDAAVETILAPLASDPWYVPALEQLVIEICGDTNRSIQDLWAFSQLEPLPFAIDGNDYIVKSGMGTFVQSLAKGLNVMTNAPVSSIATGGQTVLVTANGVTYKAKAVIVTASAAVLAKSSGAGGIAFTPALPAPYMNAFAALPLTPCFKALLGFDKSFTFDVPGASAAGFAANSFSVVLPLTNSPVSTYFPNFWNTNTCEFIAGGDLAVSLEQTYTSSGSAAAASQLLRELEATFPGVTAAWDNRMSASSWMSNPYIGGAYSAAMPGQFGARATISQPIGNQLWFAGEAVWPQGARGLMQGAYRSGASAATGALRALGLAARRS